MNLYVDPTYFLHYFKKKKEKESEFAYKSVV